MNKKDQWTNEVLNSLDGIQKAVPDDALLSRVMSQISENSLMPKWKIGVAAVAAAMLIALNIYALNINDQQTQNQTSSEYISLSNDLSIYQ